MKFISSEMSETIRFANAAYAILSRLRSDPTGPWRNGVKGAVEHVLRHYPVLLTRGATHHSSTFCTFWNAPWISFVSSWTVCHLKAKKTFLQRACGGGFGWFAPLHWRRLRTTFCKDALNVLRLIKFVSFHKLFQWENQPELMTIFSLFFFLTIFYLSLKFSSSQNSTI